MFFNGDNNLVDRCYFNGKNHMKPLIGNSEKSSRHNGVTHSFFKDIPYNSANGREIFRIWGYGRNEDVSDDGAFFTIEGNLFDHADGEGEEIISLKSNHNLVRRNTLVATRGDINLRSGNFNTVVENVILGQGVTGAYGVRTAGRHHIVQNNVICGCDYGIKLTCGEFIDQDLTGKYKPVPREDTPLGRVPRYGQVSGLRLIGNVVVGSRRQDLEIGDSYKSSWPDSQLVLIPEDCHIENNRFVRPHGGNSVIGAMADTQPPLDRFAFKPNRYAGNLLLGGSNAFAPSIDGFKQETVPEGWIEQQETSSRKPLAPGDVGPDWIPAQGW